MKPNEWKNTINVINWFKNVDRKHLRKFTIFHIKHFYPLLKNAIQFVKVNKLWIKKDHNTYDVTMGVCVMPIL